MAILSGPTGPRAGPDDHRCWLQYRRGGTISAPDLSACWKNNRDRKRIRGRYRQAMARWQSDGSPPQIEFRLADARALPFPENSVDRILCAETLEWIDDPMKLLREIKRVLKPNGIALIIHTDFDSQIFNTADKKRCRTIVDLFSDAGPNGQIGRELYGLCRHSGFDTVEPLIYPLINTSWNPDLYGYRVAHMMVDWLTKKARLPVDDLQGWLADLEQQHQHNLYFYSVNRYLCRCLKNELGVGPDNLLFVLTKDERRTTNSRASFRRRDSRNWASRLRSLRALKRPNQQG